MENLLRQREDLINILRNLIIVKAMPYMEKLLTDFDYKTILDKYDLPAIEKSPIKYFDSALKVADEFLNILQEYETAQKDTIAEFLKIALKINSKYVDNPNLTP